MRAQSSGIRHLSRRHPVFDRGDLRRGASFLAAATVLSHAPPVAAHGTFALDALLAPATILHVLIALAALAYVRGLAHVWRAAGRGRGVSVRAATTFLAGLGLLALLVSDVAERLTGTSLAAHMVQHELLMVAVAPLLALGRPLGTWTWSLPQAWRLPVARAFDTQAWRRPWRALTSPVGATATQLLLLIAWHVPRAFDAGAASPWLHSLQHASFLVPALAFWWRTLAGRGTPHVGLAIGVLFTTMVVSGGIGALLTFARHPLYATYASNADALADQQLAGLIMWIPGGTAYLVAALVILGGWLRRTARERDVAAADITRPLPARSPAPRTST